MNYKLIIVLVCVVLMYSCSRKERIESGCFQPFSVLATEYFGTNEPQRWEIVGRNAGDEFLLKNGILGFVVERNFAQNMMPLSEKGLLKFTGRVYKFWPSWAEKYLGGGNKNIQLEVLVSNGKYLVFDDNPRNKFVPSIKKRCDF